MKPNLFGMTLAQLQDLCNAHGWPRYTAGQIADWLYRKRVWDIERMTNLSLATRATLASETTVSVTQPHNCAISTDGTRKYLFATLAGHPVEAVTIPDDDRTTLCLSSQAGCKMNCRFCATGQGGYHGQLTTAEILSQAYALPQFDELTNIVFMGMGEPMDNLDTVLAATEVLTAPWGLGWSPRRITVSTIGLVPQMRRFVEQSQCHLAISLHNPVASERLALMPAQKAWPIAEVVKTLKDYSWTGQRRLSFEYTLFRNINDDARHADLLADLVGDLPCLVNLIRCHPTPGTTYRPPTTTAIDNFRNHLLRRGVNCTLRASRGQDIEAACGLLATHANNPKQ
ncbi:MAG: 23S rRNA (adenine(2503)-C(2))-methyltransferase RlmN [Bacteroidales bacterium]|nr:23S rRNA (adenine(2503)-C(2))-methyltransferase RlmN [Bacteroidales bacterium]